MNSRVRLGAPVSFACLTLFALSVIGVVAVNAQTCPNADYTLTTQAEVDAFPSSCTTVSGDITVTGSDITNLDALSALTSVGGAVRIESNPVLATLDGLSALTFVGGGAGGVGAGLEIRRNAALTNLDGLSALSSVGTLFISHSPLLTNLNGLSALTTADQLTLRDNDALASLDGLSALNSVEQLDLSDLPALTDLDGLSAITSLRSLNLADLHALTDIDGLSALNSVTDNLSVYRNVALTNLDGLSALASVGSELSIARMTLLTNLDGLSALTSVGGQLVLTNNPALTNLDGLFALTSVGGNLSITMSDRLTNLDGLYGITSVGGKLTVVDNPALVACGCGLYDSVSGGGVRSIEMTGNALSGDCNNDGADLLAGQCGFVAPTLIEPDNDSVQPPTVTLRWQSHPGASEYRVQLSSRSDLLNAQTVTVQTTEYLAQSLINRRRYYWRIKADNSPAYSDVWSFTVSQSVDVEGETTVPTKFALYGNWPNPFNPTTTISYDLPRPADVTLTVVDLLGRTVRQLASGRQPAGTYEVSFDASTLPSGIYFYRLIAGDYVVTKRMVVVR